MNAWRPEKEAARLAAPRWDGRAGRVEIWYATLTDPGSAAGYWLHAETHAPRHGAPTAHGWFARFPPDDAPSYHRFGPAPVSAPPAVRAWFDAAGVTLAKNASTGQAGPVSWQLGWHDGSVPLSPFPRWLWQRERVPGAQVVPQPQAHFAGHITADGQTHRLHDAYGAVAHVYGRSHPHRWAWLHADLGRGEICEIVAAVPRELPGLPPPSFAQLRAGGSDWPPRPAAAAWRAPAEIALPAWSVTVRSGSRRLRVWVHQPEARCLHVGYHDPDGATATCTHTERADADLVWERRSAGRWRSFRAWQLRGTAHAEVGQRP